MSSNPLTLPLSELVDVVVSVSPQLPAEPTFNQGIIIGPSQRIAGRVKLYTSLAGMAADGFQATDPEYKAATLYFGQNPAPQFLWIGNLNGGESPLQAVQACRGASSAWWGCYVTNAAKADHIAIAQYVQSVDPKAMYFYDTSDADALAGTAGNVFQSIQALSLNRAIGIYSTDQGGVFPNNNYSGAAVMGVAMGLNTGLQNSYFTLKFKTLVGVTVEPLTESQVTIIEGQNGNLYLSYGNAFSVFEQGKVGNGQFFDEILNIDMLASDIQFTLVDILVSLGAVPLTDPGQTIFLQGVNAACDRARTRGFIGQGIWTGQPISFGNGNGLQTGDPLPKGYVALSPPYSQQSPSNRAARVAQPIYVAVLEAEAAHSITIGVLVQR